jgi:hypothetical protein
VPRPRPRLYSAAVALVAANFSLDHPREAGTPKACSSMRRTDI